MSASTSKLSVRIDQLTAYNYDTWKTKMEMLLIWERLWAVVSEKKTRPKAKGKEKEDSDEPTDTQLAFDEEAEQATATIFLYLSDSVGRNVRGIRDPVQLWKKLHDLYSQTGFSTCHWLWQRLFKAELRGYKSAIEYTEEIRSIVEQLKDAGFEVHDEILAMALLQGLDGSYKAFVSFTTQVYRTDKTISFDKLVANIIDESWRMGLEEQELERALRATDSAKGKGRCGHCRKIGHRSKNCWTKHPELRPNDDLASDSDSKDETDYRSKKKGEKKRQQRKHTAHLAVTSSSSDLVF